MIRYENNQERQLGYRWYKINPKSTFELHYSIYIDEEINKKNKLSEIHSKSYEKILIEIKSLKNKGHKILLKKSFVDHEGFINDMFYNIH